MKHDILNVIHVKLIVQDHSEAVQDSLAEDQDIEKILKAHALTEGQEREDPD